MVQRPLTTLWQCLKQLSTELTTWSSNARYGKVPKRGESRDLHRHRIRLFTTAWSQLKLGSNTNILWWMSGGQNVAYSYSGILFRL